MHHLATRRDIHDPKLVGDFARTVGTLATLQKLYVLTFADLGATNPKLWNSWQDMLLGELYGLTLESFERGITVEQAQAERANRIRERVAAALGAARRRRARALPRRHAGPLLPHHARGGHPAPLRARAPPRRGAAGHRRWRTSRSASSASSPSSRATRPGLFAKLTGVLRAHGMNIARGPHRHRRQRHGGRRVPRHASRAAPPSPRDDERWERIQVAVGKVLAGELDVEQLVAQAGAAVDPRREGRAAPADQGGDRQPGLARTSPSSTSSRSTASASCSRSPTPSTTSACRSTWPRSPPASTACSTSSTSPTATAGRSTTRATPGVASATRCSRSCSRWWRRGGEQRRVTRRETDATATAARASRRSRARRTDQTSTRRETRSGKWRDGGGRGGRSLPDLPGGRARACRRTRWRRTGATARRWCSSSSARASRQPAAVLPGHIGNFLDRRAAPRALGAQPGARAGRGARAVRLPGARGRARAPIRAASCAGRASAAACRRASGARRSASCWRRAPTIRWCSATWP